MSQTMPAHAATDRPITLAAWDNDWSQREERYELVDGIPTMSPSETGPNVRAAIRLLDQIEVTTRRQLMCYPAFDVLLSTDPLRLRAPDLITVRAERAPSANRVDAADVLLIMETPSPSTRHIDLHVKRREYATARIPNYLLIDLGRDPALTLLTAPIDNDYRVTASSDTVNLHIDGHKITVAAEQLRG